MNRFVVTLKNQTAWTLYKIVLQCWTMQPTQSILYDTTFKTVGVVNGDKNFNPRGTTILQSGNVLVSSNKAHTICEYDQRGKHIQCVLTEKDGIKYPHVIKYKYGKLLVTKRIWDDPEDTHVGVKLFSLT